MTYITHTHTHFFENDVDSDAGGSNTGPSHARREFNLHPPWKLPRCRQLFPQYCRRLGPIYYANKIQRHRNGDDVICTEHTCTLL